ncbi:MAG: sigma-70 family RNA polymerase sigma factor, partial [Anaerolineaceae bacterium]|nr:sigma-70 family RNA polymerase sigma factor [Anaerolineaceae bacterium]
GWLFGAASNIIHTHLRAKYRHPEVSLSDQERLSSHDSTEEEIDKITSMDQTRLAFQALTEEQQHVLALRFSQQFSIDETAQTMNKSVNAIKVLQFRALAALRRGMEKRQAA